MMSVRLSLAALSCVCFFLFSGCSESSDSPESNGVMFTLVLIFFVVIALAPSKRPQDPTKEEQELGSLPSGIKKWNNVRATWRDPGNRRNP
ncbi:hypothetical protein KBC59_01330 [Patescibacteria group bacterium]|jgi:hypothetical protein|nr:hypothetical protein [Patescibacteria group bacterium]